MYVVLLEDWLCIVLYLWLRILGSEEANAQIDLTMLVMYVEKAVYTKYSIL